MVKISFLFILIAGCVFLFCIKLMPPIYGLIEKFTKWDLYEKGGDPFVGSSYILLGNIVGMIILYPIFGSCIFILPEILANDYSGGIYMTLNILITCNIYHVWFYKQNTYF